MKPRIKAKSLAHALLAIAAIGGVALVAIMAPNAFQILGQRHRKTDWWTRREYERRRIREALERLHQRRLVAYEERGKETYLKVTIGGQNYLKKFEFDTIKPAKPEHWDGKWRIVIFDVPEKKSKQRNDFRNKIRDFGFYQLQKSVWIYPHDCHDEVDFVTRFLETSPYVIYFETNDLMDKEGLARKTFGLI